MATLVPLEAAMQGGGNKTWRMPHGDLGRAGEQVNEFFAACGLHGEDIDESKKPTALGDRCA